MKVFDNTNPGIELDGQFGLTVHFISIFFAAALLPLVVLIKKTKK